ncbi:MAG: PorT family protein [Prevotella sp.]|nr:PorT family protein [Prevotella sp.]
MKRIITLIALAATLLTAQGQERKPQNKPYIDLRPLHFGILIGTNFQDVELDNVGPQLVELEDGTMAEQTVVVDADKWNPGFTVGVLAEGRLSNHFALRFAPSMHFGAKHLTFLSLHDLDQNGAPRRTTQDLKNTYISFPIDVKFSAPRFNNYRPYVMAGINPMLNLTRKDQDYLQLKRHDLMLEVGLGCDFYLPFFKLNPELKFCYSLTSSLDTSHSDELRDANLRVFANSVSSAHSKMIVFTLYFE